MGKLFRNKWVWMLGGLVIALVYADKLKPEFDKLMSKFKGGQP
jgi:hypothetical protein